MWPYDDHPHGHGAPLLLPAAQTPARTRERKLVACFLLFATSAALAVGRLAGLRESSASSVASAPSAPSAPSELDLEAIVGASAELAPEDTWATLPEPAERCDWVVAEVEAHQGKKSNKTLHAQYALQRQDANMYYRGVDYMFWDDFVRGGWGHFDLNSIRAAGSPPLSRTSAWTWITGDQHLSNFGAWKNRHGDIVYGVNDFDEAVVYDFQMDIYRMAVSIYDHALSNKLGVDAGRLAVAALTDSYVRTLSSYVGNEDCLLYELTSATASGKLKAFLEDVEARNSQEELMRQFTTVTDDGTERRFIFNSHTKLLPVEPEAAEQIRSGWTAEAYGATLQRVGWHALEWDPNYFRIIDMAKRIGSGDGSFGASRFYLLIAGGDALRPSQRNVILDVKSTPASSAKAVLPEADKAWYLTVFHNEAARAVHAQARLTSYTDPFTGYVELNGEQHVVRQRSAWKASFDLDDLKDADDFLHFVQQIGLVTATSHARGSYGKSPAQLKQVVASALGSESARRAWGKRVVAVAERYREQVLKDFTCFSAWVDAHWS